MKDIIKKALTIAVTFFMILTMIPLSSVKAETDSVYEPITIGKSSLNGNAIWGATEEINDKNVVLMDDSAFLYSKARYEDGGLSNDGSLKMKSGVPYQLANGNASTAYDENDCIRLTNDKRSVTMNLETLGAYDNVDVLATAGGPGTGNYADFSVTLNYTDDTTTQTNYQLYDWYDATSVDGVENYNGIRRINKNSTTIDSGSSSSGAPYLHSSLIKSNASKLIKSITFTMNGKNGSGDATGLYCCIFAITGQISSNAPKSPIAIDATAVDKTKFTANWKEVDKAKSYFLDVSKYPNFIDENGNPSFIKGYNNKEVSLTNCEVTGLEAKQKYYYRVRAKNEYGQSISSNVIKVVAMKHQHSWKYNGNENIIFAHCTSTENVNECDYQNDSSLSLELKAENAVYTGKAYNEAVVVNNITAETDVAASNITYEGIDGTSYTSTPTPPTNVGKYQASITLGGATATKTFEITKSDKSNTVITTTKKELDKVYDGKESVDVKSTSKNGNDPVIEYKKKGADDATYTTKKPTEAGDYTVRVTYPTDKNYNKSSTTKDFTIEKAKVTVKVNDLSKVYGDKDQELSYEVEGVVDGTPLKDITLSRKEGENVGTYVIKATQKEGSNPNYAITFVDGTYTIASKDSKNAKVILKNVLQANGNEQTQEIDKVIVDGKELTNDDYDVVGNVAKEPGTYTLTIRGKGNYSGEYKVTYVVAPSEASQIKEDSKGNVVIGNGTLLVNIKTEKGAPVTKLESNKAEIINMLIKSKQLTANELSEIANGADVDVILTVKDANKTITKASKETIILNTKGYTIGQYIDISLYKYMVIDGNRDEGEAVHETSDKIKVSIEIPTELINKDSKINRTYYIVRNHDGKVEILKGVYNEETNTYTFETDCFSDYAIIYKDEAVKPTATGNVNPTATETTGVKAENKTEVKAKVQKIKTGDDVFVVGYAILLVLALIGMVFLRKKENN